MSPDMKARLQDELQLLSAMYPTEISFDERLGRLVFQNDHGSFQLSIGAGYPDSHRPSVIAAQTHEQKADVNVPNDLRHAIADLPLGEEMLDMIINIFCDMVENNEKMKNNDTNHDNNQSTQQQSSKHSNIDPEPKMTTIIYLHHLLNTAKRKQVLHPPFPHVSGISKPGYPGVLIFSGPESAVREHVGELKSLNWQAFQIRMEAVGEMWEFESGHGGGVREVESMSDVMREIGEERKGVLMRVMGMK